VPLGSDAVVIVNCGAMVRVKFPVVLLPAESVTVTIIVAVPAAVGVPLSTPVRDKLKPCGTPVAFQIYGGTPPVAANWTGEYGAPTSPTANGEAVVMDGGAAAITSVNTWDAVAPA